VRGQCLRGSRRDSASRNRSLVGRQPGSGGRPVRRKLGLISFHSKAGHLRALARGIAPLDEFQREAVRAFGALLDTASARSAETFRTATITADGVDLEAIGLKRPTATWTYLVHENPFGTDIDRALRSIGRRIRR